MKGYSSLSVIAAPDRVLSRDGNTAFLFSVSHVDT